MPSDPLVKYKYTTKRAVSTRLDPSIGEMPGHQFEYIKRRNVCDSKDIMYVPKCSCKGWKGDHPVNFGMAKRQFESHIGEVTKQGTLL